MTIKASDGRTLATWLLGQETQSLRQNEAAIVEADGEELLYIIRNFEFLPFNLHSERMVWRGVLAYAVIDNLP